ncbi:MAG: peptide MFS transporter [Saprospiraceae bacterium]|nr:peptide MFS transporter [Saprospiraceae bacterium]
MAQQNNEIWGHPRGLSLLFFTEMWERFSYYGMRAIFTLYMTNALLMTNKQASQIYGSYTGLVYLTPLLGGYIADNFWGNRRSIVVGGLLMALGQFLMFGSASMYTNAGLAVTMMWGGLLFLIVGNGFFKPNISSMIGQMYAEGDRRRDAAYTIFYMGINLGAFIAPLLCGYLGDTGNAADFKWGFLAAGIGMILGTVLFQTQKDKYVVTPEGQPIGATPNRAVSTTNEAGSGGLGGSQIAMGVGISVALFLVFSFLVKFDTVASLIYSATIGMAIMIITDKSLTKIERDRILVLYVSAFFVVFFWSAFEQAGASLTFFADKQTDRTLFGSTIPASYFQSVNAVAVVLLAPVIAAIWVWLAKRNSEPNSLLKQSLGLIILALGYVVIAFGVKGMGLGDKSSMFLLIALYVIHTIGELCLSPIGLSLVSKLSPMRFVSLLFGVWFLANAIANKAAGQLSELYPPAGREYSIAAENGIDADTYKGLLEGTTQVTPDIQAKAAEANLPLEYPTFMGSPVKDLYQFFMIFVGMAGMAGLVLFGLSFPLKRMMHGAD